MSAMTTDNAALMSPMRTAAAAEKSAITTDPTTLMTPPQQEAGEQRPHDGKDDDEVRVFAHGLSP